MSIFQCWDFLGVEIFCWVWTSIPWWMWPTLSRWISSNRQTVPSLLLPCPGQGRLSENLSPYLCIMARDNCETISYPLCVKTKQLSGPCSFCWKTFKHTVLEKVMPFVKDATTAQEYVCAICFLDKNRYENFLKVRIQGRDYFVHKEILWYLLKYVSWTLLDTETCVRYDPIHTVTVWYITNNHCERLIKVVLCDSCQCYSMFRNTLWTQCNG